LRNTGSAAALPSVCERNASIVDFQSGQRRCLRSCKYFHERNYGDVAIMRSATPQTPVAGCRQVFGHSRLRIIEVLSSGGSSAF
jgi:hypothetical protein